MDQRRHDRADRVHRSQRNHGSNRERGVFIIRKGHSNGRKMGARNSKKLDGS